MATQKMWRSVLAKAREDVVNNPVLYAEEVGIMVYGQDFELMCHHADLPPESTKQAFITLLDSVGFTAEYYEKNKHLYNMEG